MTASRPRPPDPSAAGTTAEFVRSLTHLRRWAGEPPLSKLRSLGGQALTPEGAMVDALPKSTTSYVLRQTGKLPRWEFVRAFVTACLRFGDYPAAEIPTELERWRAARAVLADPEADRPTAPPTALPTAGPERTRAGGPAAADRAIELLARRVAREEDRARKGLLDGYSIAPVSYGPAAGLDGAAGMGGNEDGNATGDLHSIGTYFRDLGPQRLLIVGEPGAGKTVLAVELVLQLVEPFLDPGLRRDGRSVVPVRLPAARWTSTTPFETWLAARLVHDFGLPAKDAADLVRDRRVLPVLDGLDEMDPEPSKEPPRRAIGLLTELNRYSHLSGRRPGAVVVTCRADRYAQLAEAGAGLEDAACTHLPLPSSPPALDDAVRIHLRDLSIEQIDAYLRARWPDGHRYAGDRDAIRTALSGASGPAVHAALATPWRLLLTVTAVESGADPAELLAADLGPDGDVDAGPQQAAARIARRLLGAYVPAATKLTARGHGGPYRPEQVRSWLVNLAAHLQWQAAHSVELRRPPPGLTGIDIVPHLLWPIGGRRMVRALHFLCCVIFAVIAMVAFWLGSAVDRLAGLRDGIDGGEVLTLGLMAGWLGIAAALSLSPWPAAAGGRTKVPVRQRLIGGLLGALAGGPVGVLGGLCGLALTEGALFGAGFATVAGLAGGVVFGGVVGVTAAGRRGGERVSPAGTIRAEPAVVLGFGLCGALTGLPPLRLAGAGPVPLALGVGGAFALAVTLGVVFKAATGGWSKDAELAHPREALHRNPVIGVAFGLIGAVAAVLVFILNQGVAESVVCALVGGVAFGLAFGAIAWVRSMIGLLTAAGRGVLPLRLWTFLDWACEARLLRVSGATYQFRHRELQDFLTAGATGRHGERRT
jgi:hypothetical protein